MKASSADNLRPARSNGSLERGCTTVEGSPEGPKPKATSALLTLSGVRKRYGGVHALRDGSLTVEPGEVNGLIGENGAGKSTLVSIVAGMVRRDGGRMVWKGLDVDFTKPAEAHNVGIRMVHQESLLAPHLTVAENVFLGCEPMRAGMIDRAAMERATTKLLRENRFPLEANWRVSNLSPAQMQIAEICGALHGKASLLIFDEPTASLSDGEAARVFDIVRGLREQGIGIIYITHRLKELSEIADRITILRDGETVHRCPANEITTPQMVHHMVGRDVDAVYHREPLPPGKERLRVDLPGANFDLKAGEIVGVAGLVGAGRTKVCERIFGVDPAPPGAISVDGQPRDIPSPNDAVNAGIALVPEDRQRTGLAVRLPVQSNITMANLDGVCTAAVVRSGREEQVAESYRVRLKMRAGCTTDFARQLSGGNQQKVVIAKWMFRDTDVVIFDEPTRGIDVGAKAEVFALMDEMAREGKAILMVSSELQELLQVADRILVMREGSIVAELPRGTSQQEIMRYAAVGE